MEGERGSEGERDADELGHGGVASYTGFVITALCTCVIKSAGVIYISCWKRV